VIPNLQPGAVPSPPFPQMSNEGSGNLAGMPGYYPVNLSSMLMAHIHVVSSQSLFGVVILLAYA
jgi:hypothetical protein